ncbi:unnamed protein product [Echinostoma caproni]|uniref:DUF3402 domain-containing protein n=1 Tax=Echinostoma caproni TaxID=27848 RepID=A0A183A6L2_9TREM|nr:unnamed protein product [Echinostoma caproni]
MPELLPIDIKHTVESFSLQPEESVKYLSYLTTVICIIRITPLIHHCDSNSDAYILLEEIEDQAESTTSSRLYAVRLQSACTSSNSAFMENSLALEDADESYESSWKELDLSQHFYFDNLRELIGRVVRTMLQHLASACE